MSNDKGKLCPLNTSFRLLESSKTVFGSSQREDLLFGSESVSSHLLLLLIQDSGTYIWTTKWPYCSIHGCSSWHSPWGGDHTDNQVQICCVLLLIWLLMSKSFVSLFPCIHIPSGLNQSYQVILELGNLPSILKQSLSMLKAGQNVLQSKLHVVLLRTRTYWRIFFK